MKLKLQETVTQQLSGSQSARLVSDLESLTQEVLTGRQRWLLNRILHVLCEKPRIPPEIDDG